MVSGCRDAKLFPGADDGAVEVVDFGVGRTGVQVDVEGGKFSADSNF